MSDIIDLSRKRVPTIYTVTIVHHWDGNLEFKIDDVAEDERSREAVMHAFRRICGADAEIERLTKDLRLAVMTESEYVRVIENDAKDIRAELAAANAELVKLRERLGPRGLVVVEIGEAGHYVSVKVAAEIERLRAELAAANERTEQVRLAYDARLSLADADVDTLRAELAALRTRKPFVYSPDAQAMSDRVKAAEAERDELRAELDAALGRMSKLDFERTAAELERDALRALLQEARIHVKWSATVSSAEMLTRIDAALKEEK